MNLGLLNTIITLERLSTTYDDAGSPVYTWTTLGSIWAQATYVSGAENEQSDKVEAKQRMAFKMRYASYLLTSDRIVYEGQNYNIIGIEKIGKNNLMTVSAEVANA